MNWKAHILAAFIIYISLVFFFEFPVPNSIAALILLSFASILPDFDHPKSLIREVISILLALSAFSGVILLVELEIFLKFLTAAAFSVVVYVGLKTIPLHHRGRESLHQWRVCFLITGLLALILFLAGISMKFAAFVFVGYSVHLLIDRNV